MTADGLAGRPVRWSQSTGLAEVSPEVWGCGIVGVMADGISIEEAYRKWSDDLVGYATVLVGSASAADLVADAFAGVLARGNDAWQHVREPRGYLFAAVTNAARMSQRARDRRRRREQRWAAMPGAGELVADPSVIDVLHALSVRQRAVTYLTFWEDLRAAEVANLLGISEGAVKRHLHRAKAALRPVLSEVTS